MRMIISEYDGKEARKASESFIVSEGENIAGDSHDNISDALFSVVRATTTTRTDAAATSTSTVRQDATGADGRIMITGASGLNDSSFVVVRLRSLGSWMTKSFCNLFLPLGYPHSVRKEYMAYQICDSLQGLSSYLRGVVATTAVLEAAGVGQEDATARSAAVTWALRDGLGMVGGLLFSSMAAVHMDSYVKEFRLFADIINDIGMTLDMLAPLFHRDMILYVTSTAMICKIMCGISAGATKGSITMHFCLRGNMADLNAKEGTQETLMSLLGMILGVWLAKYLQRWEEWEKQQARDNNGIIMTASTLSWTIFLVLTLLHVYINYIGVKLLRLRTLNIERANIVLKPIVQEATRQLLFQETRQQQSFDDIMKGFRSTGALEQIPAPDEVDESLFQSTMHLLWPSRRHELGIPISRILRTTPSHQILFMDDHLFVIALPSAMMRRPPRHCLPRLRVAIQKRATLTDELRIFLLVSIVDAVIREKMSDDDKMSTDNIKSLIVQTNEFLKLLLLVSAPDDDDKDNRGEERARYHLLSLNFLEHVKGWDVQHRLYLGIGSSRFTVDSSTSDKKKDM